MLFRSEDVKLTDAGTVVRVFLVFNASVERLVLATGIVDADGARLTVLSRRGTALSQLVSEGVVSSFARTMGCLTWFPRVEWT